VFSPVARFAALAVAFVSSRATAQGPLPWPTIALERVASGFSNPTHVTHANDGSSRLFVVEQRGLVRILKEGAILPAPFLDISARVSCCGERGLLSIAFPPGRGPKSEFYADYTDVDGNTVVSRFLVSSDPNAADASSEQFILRIAQPFPNHNGGQLAFGPDGLLYVGMGDGGSAGDPNNNGQNLTTLLGKILRMDVIGRTTYAIPPTNPYYGLSSARNEIWAYGLRNPWRFSFDRKTGDLFIGDVGQGAWEEVDFQPAGAAGGANYGWRLTEGNHCFNPATGCSFAGITPPVAEYGHVGGNCSVTGGFVYRGRDFAGLTGIYFYGDYCSGRIWGLRRSDTGWDDVELAKPGFSISTFGEDEAGEIYVADYTGGVIHRLTDAAGKSAMRLVPVIVDVAGRNGAHFISELTLGNRGTTDASVDVTFTASRAFGSSGSGTVTEAVPMGRQLVFADALEYLRGKGLAIPDGSQAGTLRLVFKGISSGDAAFASVRTLAVLPAGRAGLAYPALSPGETAEAGVSLFGLREDAAFRSNLALVNAADPSAKTSVLLQVTLTSGDPGDGRRFALPPVSLQAGQWTQLNQVLQQAGMTNGWATVERVGGADPFYAYAVVNDNVTDDGAFVAPETVGEKVLARILPAAVRTGGFVTELVLTNPGDDPITLTFPRAPSFPPFSGGVDIVLQAREQRFIPDVLLYLDSYLGSAFPATALEISSNGGATAFHASARTFSSAPEGGTFSVAYSALPPPALALAEAWVFGLKQDGTMRSNLALTNTNPPVSGSPPTPSPFDLSVEFFDGDTGLSAGFQNVTLDALRPTWVQLNSPLAARGIRTGYVHVRAPVGNSSRFIVYGVVNDGAAPGQGTGDGSYLAMTAPP
jgi:glucose/arabinose dehydrogenase